MNKERIFSLDVLRGLAVAVMIFVDSPPGEIYLLFQHAQWEGITFADLAFPGFVFAMGASSAVSISRKKISWRKIFRRAGLLFLIGILFNELPSIFAYVLWENFTGADFFAGAVEHMRFFGILQRLALTYALGIFFVQVLKTDAKILAAAFVLLILSSLGFHAYSPDAPFVEGKNISHALDLIFGAEHLYTPTNDPEGLYGTVASAASMLFGFFAGRILIGGLPLRKKISSLIFSGAGIFFVGELWSFVDIIAKKLWTAPFALITSGGAIILLAGLLFLFERAPKTKNFFQAISSLGKNPLLFFLASNFALIFLWTLQVEGAGFYGWLWQETIYGFVSVEFSATIFCLAWLSLWLVVASFWDKLGIVIRV